MIDILHVAETCPDHHIITEIPLNIIMKEACHLIEGILLGEEVRRYPLVIIFPTNLNIAVVIPIILKIDTREIVDAVLVAAANMTILWCAKKNAIMNTVNQEVGKENVTEIGTVTGIETDLGAESIVTVKEIVTTTKIGTMIVTIATVCAGIKIVNLEEIATDGQIKKLEEVEIVIVLIGMMIVIIEIGTEVLLHLMQIAILILGFTKTNLLIILL